MIIDKNKLEIAMARKSLSYADLIKKTKLNHTTIYSVANERRNVRPKTVGKIAKALDVDPSEIIKVSPVA